MRARAPDGRPSREFMTLAPDLASSRKRRRLSAARVEQHLQSSTGGGPEHSVGRRGGGAGVLGKAAVGRRVEGEGTQALAEQ